MNKLQQGGTLKDYLKSNQASSTYVAKKPMLTNQQAQDNKDASLRQRYVEQQRLKDEDVKLKQKGQSKLGNAISDAGTNMLTLTTKFQTPNQEELEKGRSGWKGRGELIGDAVTSHLSNELTGGAMNYIGGKLASGEARALVNKGVQQVNRIGARPIAPPANGVDYRDLGEIIEAERAYRPGIVDRVKLKTQEAMNTKFIPAGKKQVLPNKLGFVIRDSDSMLTGYDYGVHAVDETGKSWGSLKLNTGYDWAKPAMIQVRPEAQGLRMQDVLYDLGAKNSRERGMLGVRSGDNLLSPEKTSKVYDRLNYTKLGTRVTTSVNTKLDYTHPIAGIQEHKNPNILTDWLKNYEAAPKTKMQKISVNDVLGKFGGRGPRMQQFPPENEIVQASTNRQAFDIDKLNSKATSRYTNFTEPSREEVGRNRLDSYMSRIRQKEAKESMYYDDFENDFNIHKDSQADADFAVKSQIKNDLLDGKNRDVVLGYRNKDFSFTDRGLKRFQIDGHVPTREEVSLDKILGNRHSTGRLTHQGFRVYKNIDFSSPKYRMDDPEDLPF